MISNTGLTKKAPRKRILWMDFLNICACLGVLLLHVSNHPLISFNGDIDISFLWGALTHSFVLWPVPIFIMLSGSNLISYRGYKYFYKRRLQRTVIPFIAWSIIYFILYHPKLECYEYVSTFINGHFNFHMWFFVPLFALYLGVPFLSNMVQNLPQNLVCLFFFITLIFISILPYIFSLAGIKYFEYCIFPLADSYYCYAIIGYFIVYRKFLDTYRKKIYCIAFISCIISFIVITYGIPCGLDRILLLDYTSPFCMITSIAIFLYFKNTNWNIIVDKLKINPERIKEISSCSLGIYLIHGAIRTYSDVHHLIITNPYIGALLLYIVSLCIIFIMKKILIVKYIVP